MNLSVSENIIMFVNKLSEATCHVIISTVSTMADHCLQLRSFELASLFAMSL